MSDDKKSAGKNMLEKIITMIRDDSRVLADAVMDASGTRLFEKQIEVAKENLSQAKSAISDELAKELQSSRKVKLLAERIDQQEQRIVSALGQNDEDEAFALATKMVELERDQETEAAILKSHELHLGHLTRRMENAERTLKDLERQLAMVKTTEDIQKATDVITKSFATADAKMLSAKRALERIRQKQTQIDEQYVVDDHLLEKPTEKLENKNQKGHSEGATDGAADVLKRIIDKD